ncbi:MAG: APC family permease [Acidimicrobiales bacterium]
MTGMEAISNAVSVFREPQVRNARQTLVLMASTIGTLFLATSVIAALTHAVPYVHGTPTMLSEMGRLLFGRGPAGQVAYYSLQFSTALILILGASTSFNGFPLLVSLIARNSYLPRPLTTRGHRLVYSNGILMPAGLSVVLLVVTRANVANLIPLYATTVLTGFTMAGMLRYHQEHPGSRGRRGIVVSALALSTSGIVTLIFLVTEFTRGAWAVVVVIPLIILAFRCGSSSSRSNATGAPADGDQPPGSSAEAGLHLPRQQTAGAARGPGTGADAGTGGRHDPQPWPERLPRPVHLVRRRRGAAGAAAVLERRGPPLPGPRG